MAFIRIMGRHAGLIVYKEVSGPFDVWQAHTILPKCFIVMMHHLKGWLHQPRPTPHVGISTYSSFCSPKRAWTCLSYAQWIVIRALLRAKRCLDHLILNGRTQFHPNVMLWSCIIWGVSHTDHVRHHVLTFRAIVVFVPLIELGHAFNMHNGSSLGHY